jgi:glucose-6-phosphate 1-dehydrogenase
METTPHPAPGRGLEGYERLLVDAMLGDQSLFTSAGEIERLWEISAPLLDNPPPIRPYPTGSWGPSQHSTTSWRPTAGS